MHKEVTRKACSALLYKNIITVSPDMLPMISFIVVNHNYGSYLSDCVTSIYSQTYHQIECIIIDNGSTDDSEGVIIRLQERYNQLRIIKSKINLGQVAAAAVAFKESIGHYVCFVDADDFLMPLFAEIHIGTHLSLQVASGFTSCDMVQLVGTKMVLGGMFDAPGDTVTENSKALDRRAERVFCDIETKESLFPNFDSSELSIRQVSRSNVHWVWAPTTGNVYRRDAVALFMDVKGVRRLRGALDAFLNYPINALTGSVIIDNALAAYRLHSANLFSKHPSLYMMRAFNDSDDQTALAVSIALDHLYENFDLFKLKMADAKDFKRSLAILERRFSYKRKLSLQKRLTRRFFEN